LEYHKKCTISKKYNMDLIRDQQSALIGSATTLIIAAVGMGLKRRYGRLEKIAEMQAALKKLSEQIKGIEEEKTGLKKSVNDIGVTLSTFQARLDRRLSTLEAGLGGRLSTLEERVSGLIVSGQNESAFIRERFSSVDNRLMSIEYRLSSIENKNWNSIPNDAKQLIKRLESFGFRRSIPGKQQQVN
jgi:chromosome segregation ATPase